MPDRDDQPSRGLLDPIDRISEVLFGLIMVLTFTGSLSAADAGREDTRAMLVGAIGCNLAWGLVDAVMRLMSGLTAHGRGILTLRALRAAADPTAARRIIADALPPLVAANMSPEHLDALRARLTESPEPPPRPHLSREDWLAALGVFLWVFMSTFPVVLPFVFFHEPMTALRISNAVAIAMLFLCGFALGRHAGVSPWRTGLVMVLIGAALVGITMALGG